MSFAEIVSLGDTARQAVKQVLAVAFKNNLEVSLLPRHQSKHLLGRIEPSDGGGLRAVRELGLNLQERNSKV